MNVTLRDEGRVVEVRIYARSAFLATLIYLHTDRHTPEGYYLTSAKISRRTRGGRARDIRLTFTHTGSKRHQPMAFKQEWYDMLTHEAEIGQRGNSV